MYRSIKITDLKYGTLFIISLLAVFISFTSCNDKILDEKPLDFLTPENAYVDEAGAEQGINAIYGRVAFHYFSYSDFGVMMWATMGSDEGYTGEDPSFTVYLNSYRLMTPTSRWVVDTWNAGYEIINMANVLIDRIEQADSSLFENGKEGKNEYIAEARFFRAWSYRYLVSTYGAVPLLTKPVEDAKVDFRRDSVDKIYQQMVADYKFATVHLPRPGEEAAPGRLTQGPAWHYLGETYLEMHKPDSAILALSHVVNDYNYHLMTNRFGTKLGHDIFGDGDAYYDLFTNGNQNLQENTEAMWVIQVEPFIEGGGMLSTAYIFGPRYFDVGPTPDGQKAFLGTMLNGAYTGYSDTLSRGTAECRGTNFIYYDIWNNDQGDTRHANYNMLRHVYCDNPASKYYKKPMDAWIHDYGPSRPTMLDTTKIIWPAIHTKFLDPLNYPTLPSLGGAGRTFKDWYALRFASTLLLRAEAYVDINRPDLAAADINKVRERAHAQPVNPGDVTIDYILDERARELYGEDWRLVTLRRTGKFYERVKKYNDNPIYPGAEVQPFNIHWPIPQQEIDLNSGADFPQNPGY
jgi:hypothetical protein